MKEFLVKQGDKWTLQLLDADTEENSFRVAVPSGHNFAYKNSEGVCFMMNELCFNHPLLIWQRSETEESRENVKVTIDELKRRVGVEPNKTTINAMNEADAMFVDAVNNPSHYSDSTIECIDAMEAMLSPQEFIGYLRGNMFKYQWRYQKKNGIEDLQKSEWYLKKLIEVELEKN